jgi:hypothetical protein
MDVSLDEGDKLKIKAALILCAWGIDFGVPPCRSRYTEKKDGEIYPPGA